MVSPFVELWVSELSKTGWMEAFNKRCCDPTTRRVINVHMSMCKHLFGLRNVVVEMKGVRKKVESPCLDLVGDAFQVFDGGYRR